MKHLRPYQQEAIEAIFKKWEKESSALLVLPTGTGKTVVFSEVILKAVKEGGRVLVLAHTGELLEQARDKLKKFTGLESELEKAESRATDPFSRVVVGSIQTLKNEKRLKCYTPNYFTHIIIDETHHILASSYAKILEYFKNYKLLGVTATPDRGDEKSLAKYFGKIDYNYPFPQAVKDGYLSKIRVKTLPLKLDLSKAKTIAGDFSAESVSHAIEPYLAEIAKLLKIHAKGRRILIFLPLIATSKKMVTHVRNEGFKADEVNGSSPNRIEILKDFENGNIEVLCNSMLLTEGWDCPHVDCVVVLRPTKVRSLFSQMIGRGTRLAEGKENLLIIDFTYISGKHSLCRPVTLVSNNEDLNKFNVVDEELDLFELARKTDRLAKEATKKRENSLLRELKKASKRMKTGEKDLLELDNFLFNDLAEDNQELETVYKLPSQTQINYLNKFGIKEEKIKTSTHAQKLIDWMLERDQNNMSTYKQINILTKRGYKGVENWTRQEASHIIKQLILNNWKALRHNPATYDPKQVNETRIN